MREGTARDEWRATYINTNDNRSDLLTNPLPHGEKRKIYARCYCTTYEFGEQQGRSNPREI